MKWRVMVEVTGEDGAVTQPMISEGKAILAGVRRILVTAQADTHCRHRRRCSHCGASRPLKDHRPRRLVSLFGAVGVRTPRFGPCRRGAA